MMVRIPVVALALLLALATVVQAKDVYVHGYTKSNGTYVAPHYRSAPDGNPFNNYSYPGNTNPYTGKTATGDPCTYLQYHGDGYSCSGYVSGTGNSPAISNEVLGVLAVGLLVALVVALAML